jgi:hypothetical protein
MQFFSLTPTPLHWRWAFFGKFSIKLKASPSGGDLEGAFSLTLPHD